MVAIVVPILIAAAVALFTLGVSRVVRGFLHGEKRKLAERLSIDARFDPEAASARAIKIQLEQSELPPLLSRLQFLAVLHRHVIQAYPQTTLVRFLSLSAGVAVFAGFVMLMASAALLAAAGAGYLPFFLVSLKRSRRLKALSDQIPEALDFLSRALKAGHSLSTGIQMMADELPQPLAAEFRQCYDQHSLGQSLDEALKDTAARVESTDFAFFVTAVLIQRQTGGDLSEVLKNISGMIRGRVRLQQQVKAKTAEGRLTGYIMVAFPIIMFFIASTLNPEYGQILLHTRTGLKMLGFAAGLLLQHGCASGRKVTAARPSRPSMAASQQMRDKLVHADPNARVGFVTDTLPAAQLVEVSDVPLQDFTPGDAVMIVDGNGQPVTDGTVARVTSRTVHVQYTPGGKRAPAVGDLAVRTGGGGAGGATGAGPMDRAAPAPDQAAAGPGATGARRGDAGMPELPEVSGGMPPAQAGGGSRLPPRRPPNGSTAAGAEMNRPATAGRTAPRPPAATEETAPGDFQATGAGRPRPGLPPAEAGDATPAQPEEKPATAGTGAAKPKDATDANAGTDAADKDAADKDAADKDATDKDATEKDTTGKDATDKGATDKGATGTDADKKETDKAADKTADDAVKASGDAAKDAGDAAKAAGDAGADKSSEAPKSGEKSDDTGEKPDQKPDDKSGDKPDLNK